MNLYKRPEKETDPDKYPGQIVNRPTHFEQPLVKAIEEFQRCKECPQRCSSPKDCVNTKLYGC